MSILSTSDDLTVIFGIIATVLAIITVVIMLIVRSFSVDTIEDPEHGQRQQDEQPLDSPHTIIRLIESILHPEIYRTIQRHLSAVNSMRVAIKSSVTKIVCIFQTSTRLLLPVVHGRRRYSADELSTNSLRTSTGTQHELQVIVTAYASNDPMQG